MRTTILYSDRRLVAVNKPPGISLATPKADPHGAVGRLLESVPAAQLAENGIEREQLRLVHRLDTGTSGVVLLAREPDAHSALIRMFAGRQIGKTYMALVWGHPGQREGAFDARLGPDKRDRRKMRVDPEGRSAVSRYRVRAIARYVSLLELMPETGRTHQLRVHLSNAGHWIVGDDLYSGPRHHAVKETSLRRALDPQHLLLHAWKLEIPESRGFPPLVVEAPLPPAFTGALKALGISPRAG